MDKVYDEIMFDFDMFCSRVKDNILKKTNCDTIVVKDWNVPLKDVVIF